MTLKLIGSYLASQILKIERYLKNINFRDIKNKDKMKVLNISKISKCVCYFKYVLM